MKRRILAMIVAMALALSLTLTVATAQDTNVTPLGDTGINAVVRNGVVFLVAAQDLPSNFGIDFAFTFRDSIGGVADIRVSQMAWTSSPVMGISVPRQDNVLTGMQVMESVKSGTTLGFFNSPVTGNLNIRSETVSSFSITMPVQANDWIYGYNIGNQTLTMRDYIGTQPNITIPRTFAGMPVTEISWIASAVNTTITSITIHEGITKIETDSIRNKTNLTTVTFLSATPPVFPTATRIFAGCDKLTTINVPLGTESAYQSAAALNRFDIKEHDIPAKVPGDVNNDGSVTINDALEILKVLAGLPSAAPKDVTIHDALEILKYLAGLPHKLRLY